MNIGEKSKKLLLEDVQKTFETFLRELGGTPEELTKELLEEGLKTILERNRRSLYDFFSLNNIEIGVMPVAEKAFQYNVLLDFVGQKYGYGETRNLAETEAFQFAFDILEERL